MPEQHLFCSTVGNSAEYDAIGMDVTTLVDGYKEVGSYDVQFNASKLSSGVYFYRLKAGDYVDMKKMMLMK